MCKHIQNGQVYIQAPCCSRWFECSECHDESVDSHTFKFCKVLRFTCKTCKKCFSRDFQLFSARDKHCDFCGVAWCIPGVTPESKIAEEATAELGSSLAALISPSQDYFNEL